MARRGKEMTAVLDQAVSDTQRTIADLRRQFDERTAERDEALDQQTATAEMLGVINSSPGDLAPVFNAMLEKAMRLCEAAFGALLTYADDDLRPSALRGLPSNYVEYLATTSDRPGPGGAHARLVRGAPLVHIPDLKGEEEYRSGDPYRRALVDIGGARTLVSVALRKDDAVLGSINIYRQEVRPFSDKQIALLQNFAAQAVIAMENARLITETREALDRQTAIAEVLGVINSSSGNLAPVFDAMLEKAHALCGVEYGTLVSYDGEYFHMVANQGMPDSFVEQMRQPFCASPGGGHDRLVRGERFVHVPDVQAMATHPIARASIEAGSRTILMVPLRKDGVLLGLISAVRREVRPFSDKEIALLENFAAQAVIAMENARLITETQEALDQQTATAEVLQVINSSPGNLAPVFEAMVERAMRLCEATVGALAIFEDGHYRSLATRGIPPELVGFVTQSLAVGPGSVADRLMRGEEIIHLSDITAVSSELRSPGLIAMIELGNARTALWIGLHKDGVAQGFLVFYRDEVRPFSDKQIALLQNFAAQAVIAMENARLLGELRSRTDDLQESLEYQTATSDVLKVISRSTFDLQPVLDTLVQTAARLCNGDGAGMTIREGEVYRYVATYSLDDEFWALLRERSLAPGPESIAGRTALEGRVVHIADILAEPDYAIPEAVTLGNFRTALGVPLLREGVVVGTITLVRQRVEPFTERQIEVVRTFADQAVIAIENARLLGEIRQRQAELRVTFDNMADGVVMFDEELRLAAWNRNFQELLDVPDTVLGERPSYADYLRILAERGEFGADDIEAALNRRLEHTDQELRIERTRPDGRVIEVRRNSVPDGGFVLIYSDITERKRSEAEIRAARDAAEAALRDLRAAQANLIQAEKMASLGQLTAGIAHEIKNPLNFVNNFASLSVELLDELKETTAPAIAALGEDKRAEVDETINLLTGNLEKIAEHGRRADGIVRSMLEHSRGVTGERREIDLNGLIEEALNLAYHGARAQNQNFNITLEREFDQALAPIELAPQEITRVFLNLFGNGFYAANKRQHEAGNGSFKPVLTVVTRDLGAAIEIRVRDNGIGIPAEIKAKLFQPFFTTKPTGEGTGLGLSISYDIVTQQHGGTIDVDSRVGEYTEFTVRLPRDRQATVPGGTG